MIKFIFLSFSLVITIRVAARDYFICSSCTNANDDSQGTFEQPYRSIQSGVTRVQAGETVFVMNGTYEVPANDWEPVVRITKAGQPNAWITIKNFPGHNPVIRATFTLGKWSLIKIHSTINSTPSYIIIEGLTIQGNRNAYTIEDAKRISSLCGINPDVSAKANGQGINIVGPGYCYDSDISGVPLDRIPHHIIIRNCKVFDCTSSGIAAFRSDVITIERNEIYNNCWYTTYGTSGINIYQSRNWNVGLIGSDMGIVIKNNIVYGNGTLVKPSTTSCLRYDGNGIIIDDNLNSQPGDGCSQPTNQPYLGQTLIKNNVVFGNGGSGIHLFSSQYIAVYNNTLYKNSVVNNFQEIYYRKCAFGRVFNNIFYSSDFPGKKVNAILSGNIEYDFNIHFSKTPNNYLLAYKGNGRTETHNIVVDPQLISPPEISSDTATIWTNMPTARLNIDYFKLVPTSSALNYGLNLSAVIDDLDGNTRIDTDLGAFEFQSFPTQLNNIVPDPAFRNHLIALGMDQNMDQSIQISEVQGIDTLIVRDKYNIRDLKGIEAFTDLVYLDCANNQIEQLDSLKRRTGLRYLDCSQNRLNYLDVRNLPFLERINCFNNQLLDFQVAESRNPTLRTLVISNNKLRSLFLKSLVRLDKLYCYGNAGLESICVADVPKAQSSTNYKKDAPARWVSTCEPPSDPTNIIPDAFFRTSLIEKGIDANGDGSIQAEEVQEVDTLMVSGKGIMSLAGIQAFKNLKYLDCSSNQIIHLDSLKQNSELAYLDCSKNKIAKLNLFSNTKLVKAYVYSNLLTEFKISKDKNTTLRALVITNNRLSGTLNLKTSTYLDKLWCYNNPQLTDVCVSSLSKAQTSSAYKKDAAATWTNNCGWVPREGSDLGEEVVKSMISLYPNPAKETLMVKTNEQIVGIFVKSLDGILLLQTANTKEVDINSLYPGIYLVEIHTPFITETKKLVVEY